MNDPSHPEEEGSLPDHISPPSPTPMEESVATERHVDLTNEAPKLSTTTALADVGGPAEEFQRKIASTQETVRTWLAIGAFLALVAMLSALLISVFAEVAIGNIEKVATVVITPMTGIVGTIVGFYFAERKSGK
jgi:hypothetical protein